MTNTPITDAQIVAFLDDALPSDEQARIAIAASEDPEVARRIEAMSMDRDRLGDAFESLLKAAPTLPTAEPAANRPSPPTRWWQAVAAAAILAVGIGIGTQVPDHATDDWHMAVADYQVLYATETLTAMQLTEEQRWESLASTSNALGLDLTRQDVTLDGLEFRRAQILKHNGEPLAQLAFLDGKGNAIAFCFTRTGGPDKEVETTTLAGLNTMTWQHNGIGFILIGDANQDNLTSWQSRLAGHAEI